MLFISWWTRILFFSKNIFLWKMAVAVKIWKRTQHAHWRTNSLTDMFFLKNMTSHGTNRLLNRGENNCPLMIRDSPYWGTNYRGQSVLKGLLIGNSQCWGDQWWGTVSNEGTNDGEQSVMRGTMMGISQLWRDQWWRIVINDGTNDGGQSVMRGTMMGDSQLSGDQWWGQSGMKGPMMEDSQ